MSSARPRSRALRVGVVLSDTVIAEHVVRSGTAFTIGQSIRNLVPLPIPGLPRRWQLIELVEHGVLLRLGPGMGARVSIGGQVLNRSDLDQRGAATRTATLVTVPSGCHGKLDLGEVQVLFQELELPPPAPVPALPRSIKGTLADRIDKRMAAFAAASLLVHFGIMTAASFHDGPGDATPAERAMAQYTTDTVSIIDADDPILDLDREPAPAKATPDQPAIAPAQPAPPASTEPSPARPSPSRPPVAQPVVNDAGKLRADATRYAVELFSSDTGGGTLAVDMPGRRPGVDLDKQLGELRDANANVAIGKPTTDHHGDGTPRIGTTQNPDLGPGTGPITKVDDDDKIEKSPPTRIDVVPRPPPVPGVDTEAIIAKIRTTYMGGLQRCYKKALGPRPGLAGKVTISFTLTEKGKVVGPSAKGVDEALEVCVAGLMGRWSFTPVTDEDGDPLEIDLDVTLQLGS